MRYTRNPALDSRPAPERRRRCCRTPLAQALTLAGSTNPWAGPPRPHRRVLTLLTLTLAALLGLLSACSSGNDSQTEEVPRVTSGESAAFAEPAAEAAEDVVDTAADEMFMSDDMDMEDHSAGDGDHAAPASGDASENALAVETALTPVDLGREIIYRASVAVEADDVTVATREAVAIVGELGGIVFSQTTRGEPQPRAEITFKVLPADFSTALERLAGVGRLVNQSVSADDVTERVVDLASRITTASKSVVRLRDLLDEATDLEDVAEIENSLLRRETTLETLRAQLRTLRDQVDLATITLTITQSPTVLPDTAMVVTAWVSDEAEDPCLGNQDITVEPDSVIYLCLEVENTGASELTDISLRWRNVRLNVDSFEARRGSFDRIEPGELLAATLAVPVEEGRLGGRIATRGLEIRLEAEAVPVDTDGTALTMVRRSSAVWVQARTHDSLPGFADSIGSGAGFLRSILSVALIALGWLVPFLPLMAVLGALGWWLNRRQQHRPAPVTSERDEEATND